MLPSQKAKSLLVAVIGLIMLALPLGAASAEEVVATGTFKGASSHVTTGTVNIIKTDDGLIAVLESDFNHDGAPDPKLGFGKDGYDTGTTFSKLKKLHGKQTYKIPASIDPSQYNEFYIWCEKYAVPLGVAKLN